ncbi:MAG: CBS domain-containing protein [Chloroflexota bacterium]
MRLVRDLMHPGLVTCRPETTLGQAAVLLTQHRFHSLIVADGEGRPLGILTDFDLLAAEWLSTDDESLQVMRKMTAGELMTTPIDTIGANEPASVAAERMHSSGISRLMVTEGGNPVGVISVSDLVASLVRQGTVARATVADVMSRAYLVCRDTTPVASVARGMTDARYRSVLVVNDRGQVLGVVSGLDLIAYCREEGCGEGTAAQVMHPALTIHPTASLREAADKMIDHHHHRLVVVDPSEQEAMPLGIISSYDIVAEMAQPGSVWRANARG